MRGVAGEEHSAGAVGAGLSALGEESGAPAGFAHVVVGPCDQMEGAADLREVGPGLLGAQQPRADPEPAVAEREDHDRALRPDLRDRRVGSRGQAHVGEQHRHVVALADEPDVDQVPDGAVGAVGADHVLGDQFGAVVEVQPH